MSCSQCVSVNVFPFSICCSVFCGRKNLFKYVICNFFFFFGVQKSLFSSISRIITTRILPKDEELYVLSEIFNMPWNRKPNILPFIHIAHDTDVYEWWWNVKSRNNNKSFWIKMKWNFCDYFESRKLLALFFSPFSQKLLFVGNRWQNFGHISFCRFKSFNYIHSFWAFFVCLKFPSVRESDCYFFSSLLFCASLFLL